MIATGYNFMQNLRFILPKKLIHTHLSYLVYFASVFKHTHLALLVWSFVKFGKSTKLVKSPMFATILRKIGIIKSNFFGAFKYLDKNLSDSWVWSICHEPFRFESYFKIWSFVNISTIPSCSSNSEPGVSTIELRLLFGSVW